MSQAPTTSSSRAKAESSDSLSALQDKTPKFDQSPSSDDSLTRSHNSNPTANVLHSSSSATIGTSVGLAFSPTVIAFTGIGVLFLVSSSPDLAIERIRIFFQRSGPYVEALSAAVRANAIVKTIVGVLFILAIVTKVVVRRKLFLKKLTENTNNEEDAQQRLDGLTQEEGRMSTVGDLKATNVIGDEVQGPDDGNDNRGKGVDNSLVIAHDEVKEVERNRLQYDIRRWLSPLDPSTNHNVACSTRYRGTATWFIRGSIYEEWKTIGSLLWIHGKPGSGKSVLCSAIIEDIAAMHDAGKASMSYFYFDFRDYVKRDLRGLVLSLLTQLSSRSGPCFDILSRLYEDHEDGARQPSDGLLTQCLKEMLTLPDQRPIFIIMDALDECPQNTGMPPPREKVLQLMIELVNLHLPNLHICVTSRPEIDIRDALDPLSTFHVSLHDQSGQREDIVDCIKFVVYTDRRMRKWREEDKAFVIEMLSAKADGMFRWVFCQLDMLRRCIPSSLRSTLDELPKTLDETYERVLLDIPKEMREHVHRLFQCLAVAIRPLRVEELAETLALDFGVAGEIPMLKGCWRSDNPEQAVLSICSSLIAIVEDGHSRVVQFSHFSVREFLTSDRLFQSSSNVSRYGILFEPAHTTMAQACLSVLLCLNSHIDRASTENFPLVEYATQHWAHHTEFGDVLSRIRDAVDYFLDPDNPHFAVWLWLSRRNRSWMTETHPTALEAAPLYYMAEHGFHGLVRYLILKRPQDVQARAGFYGTPLHATLHEGHFEVFFLLLQHCREVDVRDFQGRTTLHLAASDGHLQVLRTLIKHGADINARDDMAEAPLYQVLEYINYKLADSDFNVIQLLLEHGADVNAKNDANWTPLHRASCYGSHRAAEVLLQNKAKVNLGNNEGRTPLHYAMQSDVAELLLSFGADRNARDAEGSTPLHVASSEGKLEVVQLLLNNGADFRARNNEDHTPFDVASARGHQAITKMLSEHMES